MAFYYNTPYVNVNITENPIKGNITETAAAACAFEVPYCLCVSFFK